MMLLRLALWVLPLLLAVPPSLSISGPHIADVNILLPPKMTNPVEYRLQGSDGCFQWSWDHHDILSVLPEYNSTNHCSTSARLRSIAPYSGRKETAVYATDVHTGILVRCKVFIDMFSRIQIFHNSIKLDLDGLATLRVRAFDTEDNVFSSLVGLQFMWQMMPETDGLSHHLVHVPLRDSPLSDCGGLCGDLNVQIKIEETGAYSDLYVVKGSQVGHEIVSVHLLEPKFEHMGDEIVLTVAEAMSLYPPSPVFVLIGTSVDFDLKVIRANTPQVVTLPSTHYRWSVSNTSVAQMDSAMGIAYASDLGVTSVTVEDTRVAGHVQMSTLHVVVPDNLCLHILPLSSSGDIYGDSGISSAVRWYIISGRQYVVHMKVFSQGPGSREIYVPENEKVKLQYESENWKTFLVPDILLLKHRWSNSRILEATSHGLGKLSASLAYTTGHPMTNEVLRVVQEVMVCEPVKIRTESSGSPSNSIILPWAPSVFQEVELLANGGCADGVSDYKWFSSDMAIVSISASGLIQAKKPGKATVKVVSIFDAANFDEVVIEVSIPSSMLMMQSMPVEAVVGSHLQAAVTMKAANGAYFYKCDAFNSFIHWKVGSESFTVTNATRRTALLENVIPYASASGPPCAWAYLYASVPGRAMLHAILSKDYQDYGPIILKALSQIAAYAPLKVFQAGDGNRYGGYWLNLAEGESYNTSENIENLYLTPGAQMDVMLVGGPEPWDHGVEFVETAVILKDKHEVLKDSDLIHRVSTSYGSLYRVFCKSLGNFKILFKRGNLVGDDHPLPSLAESEMLISCSFPSSIVVIVDEPVNAPDIIWDAIQVDRDPGRVHVSPITVANSRTIRIAAAGVSNTGVAFSNSSSLCMRWELSNCDGLAYWNNAYNHVASISSWEMFLALQNRSGMCIVRAMVTGFSETLRYPHYTSSFQSLKDVLTDAVRLQLVSALRVEPESALVFHSPDVKVSLSITGGSCLLEAVVNDSRVVETIQSPPGLQCSQLILAPKGLGTALLTVYDTGLAPPLAASSLVEVADVDWIRIIAQEEISLMEGSLHTFNLLVGVIDGRTFDSSQYVYMDLFVHIEDHTVVLVDDDADFGSAGGGFIYGPNFTIIAKKLGVTSIYVSARHQSGNEITSKPVKVEVYTAPRIHPEKIVLVPGASYVFTLKGGPTIRSNIEYASMDDKTAAVQSDSGRLMAMSPGNTTLIARVFGNGDMITCQAYATVNVMIPFSMALSVQSDQLGVGLKMPIHPSLPEGDLFSFYGRCKGYEWTIQDEEVLSFQTPDRYSQNGRNIGSYMDEDESFINVLYGRSSGRTSVAVSFSCDFISSGSFSQSRSYNASVSLWVVSDLPLALGLPITWILPPYYTSSSLLPSSEASRQTDRHRGIISYSLLRYCSEKTDELHKGGISIVGDKIETKDSGNLACIQAKDHNSGKIEVAACLRVAEVSQIRINNMEYPFHVINLAVGAEVELPIKYYDNLGNLFHEANNAVLFDVETNFPDVISFDTHHKYGNLHIKGAHHGAALLRVSMRNNLQKSDYMLISVGARLSPHNPVVSQGSSLNFSIEGLNDKVSGSWWSANESVVFIDKHHGKAKLVGEGVASVHFEGSNLALQTTVTVLKGDIIFVDAPKEALTNVLFPLKGYKFLVRFSKPNDQSFSGLGKGKKIFFDCRVDPPYLGYAKPWRDLDSGSSYCLFSPYSPEHLVHSAPYPDQLKDVYISVNVSMRGANHVHGSASALFIGGFSILGMTKDPFQLNFTPDCNNTIITIVGNTDIEFHWQKHDLIMITPVNRDDLGFGGHAHYEVQVKVQVAERFTDRVNIMLPANGQRVEVEVTYEPSKANESASSSVNITLWAGILGCISLLIITVFIFMCFLDSPEISRPPAPPATPNFPSPATPDRTDTSVYNEQTPRTPSPFVDYVRRTLDETPNYRRDGRRRFNPQNTF